VYKGLEIVNVRNNDETQSPEHFKEPWLLKFSVTGSTNKQALPFD